VSGLHHVELRPRSLRYYTTERPQRLCRKQARRRHSRAKTRYRPSGHMRCKKECPLWAKSGRELDAMHQRTRALLFYEKDTVKRCPSVARMF
jgi:hypothetical protein